MKDEASPAVWGATLAAAVAAEAWRRVTEEKAVCARRSDRCCANIEVGHVSERAGSGNSLDKPYLEPYIMCY